MSIEYRYLSHILDNDTPTYGNAYNISIKLTDEIQKGAVANESTISTTTHIGTHIDLPYHFFAEGETIEAYDASFWIFRHPLLVEIDLQGEIIKDELISALEPYRHKKETDLVMVKTGVEKTRGEKSFWANNPGFAPELYDYLLSTFPKVRAFGFDAISLSAYRHPLTGRKAHRSFLNPDHPILIIEDMHLSGISTQEHLLQVIIAPLRIARCDGMPCTIIAAIQ